MLITLRAQRVKPYCPWSFFFFKVRAPDTDDVKKRLLCFLFRKKNCLLLFYGSCSFVLRHPCQVHEVNAPPWMSDSGQSTCYRIPSRFSISK